MKKENMTNYLSGYKKVGNSNDFSMISEIRRQYAALGFAVKFVVFAKSSFDIYIKARTITVDQ
jgi:hypothetical protein